MAEHSRLKGPLPRGPLKIGRCMIFVDVSNECILLWHTISIDCDGIVWDTVTVSIGVWLNIRSINNGWINRNELTIVHWLAYNSHRSLQRMHRCFVYHNFCMYRQDTIYNTITIYFKFILSWNAYDFRPFHNYRPIIFVVYYTAAQKFPFKIAKQASTMNPDIISKSCTYINSVIMPVYWVFYC